jgi:glycosyltransferase involved in cell wall biosynthesis
VITPVDPGIGTYTYELVKALGSAGVVCHVYTGANAWITSLPRVATIYPVLGRALVRQRSIVAASTGTPARNGGNPRPLLQPMLRNASGVRLLRRAYLSVELAVWLKFRGYDMVWTQWPEMDEGSITFWRAARALRLPVVHTAHNVLPHERVARDRDRYGAVFRRSRAVIVHSESARRVLLREYPYLAPKAIASWHGLYTTYPRLAERRPYVRARLGIAPETHAVLLFGGVRPYKNVDSLIDALAADRQGSWVLVVAGHESGYDDCGGTDRLSRTRRLVEERGLQDRVRLLAGPFSAEETAELFEASDMVALPYLESYGSGLLLLAMSFGKLVIATRTGGMDEYVQEYPAHVLMESARGDDVLAALHRAQSMLPILPTETPRPPSLEWSSIVADLIPRLEAIR